MGTLCFLDRPQQDKKINDKFEATQGLHSCCACRKVKPERDPEVFLGHMVFWRPGVPRTKTTHVPETSGFLTLPPSAARPKKHLLLENLWFFALGTPGLHLAVHWQFGILIFPVFGRFSATLGPKTPLERRGSSCSDGCTKNQPRRQTSKTHPNKSGQAAFRHPAINS